MILHAYTPEHFQLFELVPERTYREYESAGRLQTLWNVFDPRFLWTLDALHGRFGTIVLNDWYWRGHNHYRGWRPIWCTVGADLSQHRYGRGGDCKSPKYSADEMREDILRHRTDERWQYITALELGIPWLHYDVRLWDTARHGLLLFNP